MDFLQKYQTLPKGNLKIDYTKKKPPLIRSLS